MRLLRRGDIRPRHGIGQFTISRPCILGSLNPRLRRRVNRSLLAPQTFRQLLGCAFRLDRAKFVDPGCILLRRPLYKRPLVRSSNRILPLGKSRDTLRHRPLRTGDRIGAIRQGSADF